MQILEQVGRVAEALKSVDVSSAIRLMSILDIAETVDETFIAQMQQDAFFLEMAALSGTFLDEETRSSLKKGAQKDSRVRQGMGPIYKGIPKADADVGHAAFNRSRQAMGTAKDTRKTDLEKQHAHVKAYRAHEYARNHLKSKGHELAAHVHHKAMGYHDVQIDQHAHAGMKSAMGESMRAVAKDQRKMDAIKTSVAPHYQGVADSVAKWGHEAHSEGLRAHGMEKDQKAPLKMKIQAHHEAQQAHSLAAQKLSQAGHEGPAMLHKQAASYHGGRKAALSSQQQSGAVHAEEMPDLRNVSSQMHVAAWRMKNLAGKKKKPPSPLPKTEWLDRIEEGEYSDEVKNASKAAANATKVAKEPNASPEHHDTAARLHFTAHGIAKAQGHTDLAAKHFEFMNRHRELAKTQKATGT